MVHVSDLLFLEMCMTHQYFKISGLAFWPSSGDLEGRHTSSCMVASYVSPGEGGRAVQKVLGKLSVLGRPNLDYGRASALAVGAGGDV